MISPSESFVKNCLDNTYNYYIHTAQKMKFSIKDFLSKCDQIRRKLRICLHLLRKSLMKNFIFRAVIVSFPTLQINKVFGLRICLHLLKKSLTHNFIFDAVQRVAFP